MARGYGTQGLLIGGTIAMLQQCTVESMLEVVESLLALSRNLLAVVERRLAPSFGVHAKICASRRA